MRFVRQRLSKNAANGAPLDQLAVEIRGPTSACRNAHRFKTGVLRFMQCVFLFSWIFINTDFIPDFVGKCLLIAGSGLVIHGLLHFQRWNDEIPHLPRFLAYAAFMAGVLAAENFFVWVVSASDLKHNKRVPPLQDNVELLVKYMIEWRPYLRSTVMFRWADIKQFLGVTIALGVSVLWDQVPYSGFGMMGRVVLTIGISHMIRVICFLVTVVPSPKPGCYAHRFPPVPDNWWDFIIVGFDSMKGSGGCNDLIFSGHCAIWILGPLTYHSYYKGRGCWLLWIALLHTCVRTVVEHHHYSVDMFVAAIVVPLVWRELNWVYPVAVMLPEKPQGSTADPPNPKMAGVVVTIILIVIWFVLKSHS